MIPKTPTLLIIALVCTFMFMMDPGSASVAGARTSDEVLTPGEYDLYEEDDVNGMDNLEIELTSNATVDIYLIEARELDDFEDNRSFEIIWSAQRVTEVEETVEIETAGNYVIIVDNSDNHNDDDAVPEGNVSYSLTYEIKPFELTNEFYINLALCCILPVVVIIIVIIVGVWYFLRKRKEKREREQNAYYQQPPPAPYYGQDDFAGYPPLDGGPPPGQRRGPGHDDRPRRKQRPPEDRERSRKKSRRTEKKEGKSGDDRTPWDVEEEARKKDRPPWKGK
jgi:hypothetical protein